MPTKTLQQRMTEVLTEDEALKAEEEAKRIVDESFIKGIETRKAFEKAQRKCRHPNPGRRYK